MSQFVVQYYNWTAGIFLFSGKVYSWIPWYKGINRVYITDSVEWSFPLLQIYSISAPTIFCLSSHTVKKIDYMKMLLLFSLAYRYFHFLVRSRYYWLRSGTPSVAYICMYVHLLFLRKRTLKMYSCPFVTEIILIKTVMNQSK